MKSVENVFNYFKDMCFGDKGIGEKVQMWSFKRTFRMGSKFLPLTDAGLEKKFATVCPLEDISLRASFYSASRFPK